MNQNHPIAAGPQLSPGFDNARRVSRVLAYLLALGFRVTLVWQIAMAALLVWPTAGSLVQGATVIPAAHLSSGARAAAIIAILLGTVPSLVVLQHARRVFAPFANGEVFGSPAITHIRLAGFWLIVCAFASAAGQVLFTIVATTKPAFAAALDFRPLLLVFGIATYAAAYVMAEARRIADDNASIVS